MPEKFGAATQSEIDGMAGFIAGFGKGFEKAAQLHAAVDAEVAAALLRLYTKVSRRVVRFEHTREFDLKTDRLCSCSVSIWPQNLHTTFRDRLQRLFPHTKVIHRLNDMKNDARVATLLPPVKSLARLLANVHEYSLDETSKWPHSLSVGDVLRATMVCFDGFDGDDITPSPVYAH